MNEKTSEIGKVSQLIEIKFAKEVAMNRRNGKLIQDKDIDGNLKWSRHDGMGLLRLLSKYDTRKNPPRDWPIWSNLLRKIEKNNINEAESLKLTTEESVFLRHFLDEFTGKEAATTQLSVVEVESMVATLAQLPE